MSTRANIVLKDQFSTLWFYRHSDGYPAGTMPSLKKFMQWVVDGKIRNNGIQGGGWLIIIGADEYKRYQAPVGAPKIIEEWDGKIPNEPIRDWKVGAYEPTDGKHGDIEYLYTIDLDAKTIKINDKDPISFADAIKKEW